jgi:hypothetical protein
LLNKGDSIMDYAGIVDIWRNVLLRPSEEPFVEEKARPSGTLTTAIIWVFIAAVIAAVLGWIRSLLFAGSMAGMESILGAADLPPEVSAQLNQMFSSGFGFAAMGAGTLWGIILAPVGFLIGVGITHLLARALGGTGTFDKMAYLMATFQVPITIANAVIAFIPVLGGCVAFLLSIYGLVLSYFAVKVNYELTSGKAIAVVVIPILVVMLLAACVAFAVVGWLISVSQ